MTAQTNSSDNAPTSTPTTRVQGVRTATGLAAGATAAAMLSACAGPTPDRESSAMERIEGDPPAVLVIVTSAETMTTSGKETGLWLEEYAVPFNIMLEEGIAVTTASIEGGPVPIDPRSKPEGGWPRRWDAARAELETAEPLSQVVLGSFDAVYVPGGHGAMFDLAESASVATALTQFAKTDRPIAAVCHGPAALVDVKDADGNPIVRGKRVSVFTNSEEESVGLTSDMPFLLETRLRRQGARIVSAEDFEPSAVRDGLLITGQNPASSERVARLLLEAINDRQTQIRGQTTGQTGEQ